MSSSVTTFSSSRVIRSSSESTGRAELLGRWRLAWRSYLQTCRPIAREEIAAGGVPLQPRGTVQHEPDVVALGHEQRLDPATQAAQAERRHEFVLRNPKCPALPGSWGHSNLE